MRVKKGQENVHTFEMLEKQARTSRQRADTGTDSNIEYDHIVSGAGL